MGNTSGTTGNGDSNNTTNTQSQTGTQTQNTAYGGQGTYGGNASNSAGTSQINYLDPAAISAQQQQYGQQTGTAAQNAADTYGNAYSGYSALENSGGYSPAVQQAIAQTQNSAIQQTTAQAQNAAAGHAAETGNDASYTAGQNAVTANAANTAAAQQRQDLLQFAQEQERQKELGLSGMQQLTGVENASNLGLMGQAQGLNTLKSGESTTGSNTGNQYGVGVSAQQQNGQGLTQNQGQTNQLGSYSNQNVGSQLDTGTGTNSLLGSLMNALGLGTTKNPSTGGVGGGGSSGGGGATGTPNTAGPVAGSHYDQNGDLVNSQGQPIDGNGNVIDTNTNDLPGSTNEPFGTGIGPDFPYDPWNNPDGYGGPGDPGAGDPYGINNIDWGNYDGGGDY